MRRFWTSYLTVSLACLLVGVVWGVPAQAQQITVTGRVVDAAGGQPIVAATVSVEGGTATTTTSERGEFSIRVPSPTATLVVNRAGFAIGRVTLKGQTEVVVRLAGSVVQLEEVVVVGYGTQRRSDVTGSVASVSAERLENTAATSVEQTLQGSVAGVQITTTGAGAEPSATFRIRGRTSILANAEPLIVVDGIPYEGNLAEINQNDVASINVLKDASAAAIYGARGSNGVVLITTKRGGGSPRISYDGYAGVQEITNLPRLMSGAEFAEFKCVRLGATSNCNSVLTGTEIANRDAGRTTDWIDLATRTGAQQNHNLSFAGGGNGTRYYVAASLLDVSGVAINDEFRRASLRVNLDQELKSWVRLGTNTQFSQSDRDGLRADFEDAFFMNPLTNAFEADGTTRAVTPWPEDIFWGNPLQGLDVVDDDQTRRVFSSNYLEVEAPFFDGLSYRLNGGMDWAVDREGRYYGRNTLTGLQAQGRASTSNATDFDWTVENLVRFQRNFGDHGLDLTTLYSFQENSYRVDRLASEGFPNDVLTYYQANVGALVVPSYDIVDSRLISQMARVNYTFADRYLLTVTARRDGYSGFGDNNKFGLFPSVALGWNLSNEPFWPGFSGVSSLKLRGSFGQNGNQAVSPYRTLARLEDYSYLNGDVSAPGFIPQTLGNPNLKWETTTAFNAGLDFGLFDERVTGAVDIYRKRTRDLLLNRLISPVHGITRIADNIGEVQNQGVELQLSSINLERGDLTWTTDFNISANRNEILDLYGDGVDDTVNRWFIGQPIDVQYDYRFEGIWQAGDDIRGSAQPTARPGDVRIVDVNGDGIINASDRTFIGDLEPDYSAGLMNTFRWRGLSLNAFFHAVQGVVRDNGLLGTNLVHNEVRRNTLFLQHWTPENPIGTYPRNSADANPLGVAFLEDASFVRLKDLTLSYALPESVTGRLGTQNLRLYLSGRNLWTHTEWSGMDPELSNANQRGVPLERVFVGGINVAF